MVSWDEKEKVIVVYYVLCNAGDDKNAYVAYRKYITMYFLYATYTFVVITCIAQNIIDHYKFLFLVQ